MIKRLYQVQYFSYICIVFIYVTKIHSKIKYLIICIFNGIFFIVLARSVSHTITTLEVPLYADPRRDAELRCHYTKQQHDPALHSVKWYRDMHEIFRYTLQEVNYQYN